MKSQFQKTTIRKIFLNKSQEKINLIRPWSYYGILGRGSGKSTRILALRTINAVFQMPGSCLCFFGNSYLNLGANLVPKIISGWKELGYIENWDFVLGQPPPSHFKPLITAAPDNWKHTILWANGSIFHLGSMDRLQNILSHSFQHFFGDEARIIDYEKVSQNAFPTMRGERIRFGNATMFGGFSFTSDMPDNESGQWLLEKADVMDEQQIELILRLALEENKILLDLSNVDNVNNFEKYHKDIKEIRQELNSLRTKSVYFDEGSSLVNIDALGIDYIETMYQTLTWSTFKSSILNILSPDEEKMFYFKMHPGTFIPVSYNYALLDKQDIRGAYIHDSRSDLNTDPERELFAGMDFGNMNSMTLSQKYPAEFRTVKNLFVLQPQIIDDLAVKFTEYYKHHRNKVLRIDYDRAGNNRMANSNKTIIQQFRDKILEQKQGWRIMLNSINMRNVPHSDRRILINKLMAGMIPGAPKLTIDEGNCKELKSSLTIARIKPGTSHEKDKSSEKKRNLQFLPMYSTNFSDAYDYSIWGNFFHLLNKTALYADMTPTLK